MTQSKLFCILFASLLSATLPVTAQQSLPAIAPPGPSSSSQQIHLDVVVDSRSGEPVNNLRLQDFTILDNKSPRPITSFKVVTPAKEPVEVILLLDAVNTPFSLVSFMRSQTEKFLKANGGKLAHPTTIAVLRDKGVQTTGGFSTDGNSLSNALEHYNIGLRQITQGTQWTDNDRLTICLNALNKLNTYAANLPGRKLILWISPGFPLLSGPNYNLTASEHQQVFGDIVFLSSQLRKSKITLYDVNPTGVSEGLFDSNYYLTFVKGIAKPDDAQFASIGIQVLSVQTGGLTLESESDVARMIERCVTDADSWYEIAFDPLPADKPNEYHHIDVRLGQPGLVARTRDGYYANPLAANTGR